MEPLPKSAKARVIAQIVGSNKLTRAERQKVVDLVAVGSPQAVLDQKESGTTVDMDMLDGETTDQVYVYVTALESEVAP